MIAHAVKAFNARGLEIGICGQAPSDYPDEVPRFLVGCGITSISVTPDTVLEVRRNVAASEMEFSGRARQEGLVEDPGWAREWPAPRE
jgi:pyruvate,water dikinase